MSVEDLRDGGLRWVEVHPGFGLVSTAEGPTPHGLVPRQVAQRNPRSESSSEEIGAETPAPRSGETPKSPSPRTPRPPPSRLKEASSDQLQESATEEEAVPSQISPIPSPPKRYLDERRKLRS